MTELSENIFNSFNPLTIFISRMFVDGFIECVAWSYWWTWCVLLIIWILYCWSFVPLVSFCSDLILMPKRMHLIQKGHSSSKHFSFFVFYFDLSKEFYKHSFIKFGRIFQPPSHRLFQPSFYWALKSMHDEGIQTQRWYKVMQIIENSLNIFTVTLIKYLHSNTKTAVALVTTNSV